MFAVITRFDVGLFTWAVIGVGLGYAVALFEEEDSPRLLIPMILGLIGGLIGGGIVGAVLTGHELWESNVAAVAGASVLATGWHMVRKPGIPERT